MESAIRVLHVDDDPSIADLVATFLTREDDRFDVETASNVDEGLSSLEAGRFDCIVSDYDMPGKNGIQFLEVVRETYPDLPFILYTGKGSEEVASEAISAGVTDYLQKGQGTSQYQILIYRILNAVEKQRVHEQALETEERLHTIAENSNDVLWLASEDREDLQFINSAYEELWGRSMEELEEDPDSFLKGIHPEDRDRAKASMAEVAAGNQVDIEYRVNAAEDYGRWVWVQGTPVFDEAGEVAKIVGFARDITEKKKEQQKREKIISRMTDAIIEVDADWRFTLVNEQAEDLYGMDEGALLGRELWEVFPEALDSRFEAEYRGVMESREPASFVESFSQLDGWFDLEVYPKDDGGIAVYFLDVTDSRERQRDLEETNTLLSTLSAALPQGVLVENDSRGLMTTNRALIEMTDWSGTPEDLIGTDVDHLAHKASTTFVESEQYLERRREVREKREPVDNEELALDDGSVYERTYRPIELPKEKAHLWVYRDVTEQKERERRQNAIFNHTYQFTGLMEPDGTLIEANETALEFGGLDREDVIGQKLWKAHWFQQSEDTRERAKAAVERAADGEFVRHQLPVQGVDEDRVIDFSVRPLTDERGNVTLLIPEGRDITELKERDRELEASQRRLDAILANTSAPMFMKEDTGEYIFVNQAYRDAFGLNDADMVGRTDHDIHPAEMADRVRANDRIVLETGETLEAEEEITVGDERRIYLTSKAPIYDTGVRSDPDDPVAVFGVASDITDRLEQQAELQRERDRLDEFAGIVSHDLRNPISVFEGRLEMARDEHDSEHFDQMENALDRMQRIIEDVLWLAQEGKDIGRTEPVCLATAIEDAWEVVENDRARTEFVNAAGDDRTIDADSDRLGQLLENLFGNALEHTTENVAVTVGELADGFYVEDDGPGISGDNREDVFEAGYSTSESGTGFGMRIVKRVAEAHDWHIAVTESADGGARFEITGVEGAA